MRFIENLSYSCFIWHLSTIWFEYNKILELNCKTDSVELLHQAEMIWILQKVSELSSKLVYFSIIVVLVKYYWLFLNFWHNSFQFLFHKFLDIWKFLWIFQILRRDFIGMMPTNLKQKRILTFNWTADKAPKPPLKNSSPAVRRKKSRIVIKEDIKSDLKNCKPSICLSKNAIKNFRSENKSNLAEYSTAR